MGESAQEKATQSSYEEIGGMQSQVNNLFEGYRSPFSAENILSSIDDYTNKAIEGVHKRTATDIQRSNKNVGSRLAGSGIKGGAIYEDAIASGENRARLPGARQISSIQEEGLAARPGVFDRANQMDLNITGANQNVLFQNLANLFRKKGMKADAAGMLNDDTWFDDFLATLNTAGNVAGNIFDPIKL